MNEVSLIGTNCEEAGVTDLARKVKRTDLGLLSKRK